MDKLVRRATVGETKVSNLKVNSRTTDPVGEGAGQTLFQGSDLSQAWP